MSIRSELIRKMWRERDPFDGFQAGLYRPDSGGWQSSHRYLVEAIDLLRPSVVVEIGVWNGMSTRTMANRLRDQTIDGVVICVDTWLGSSDHWTSEFFDQLRFVQGYPTKIRTFMANVVDWDLVEQVVPLPLDSLNAAEVLKTYDITPDLIHLDGAHDYESVSADLRTWWPRLRPGGLLIGDDYYETIHWPGVKRAFDEFFESADLYPFEHTEGKCRVNKPR